MSAKNNQPLLVAVDVDGTLLDTEFDDVLRPREIEAMDAVRAAGHVLALCTGRNLNSIRGLMEYSNWDPVDLPMVLLNGAVVWGGRPRRRLVCNVLVREQILELVRLFREHGTVPMVYGTDDDGGVLHHEMRPLNDILGRYIANRRQTVGAIHTSDDLTALAWDQALEVGTIDSKDRVQALSAAIAGRMDGQVNVINTRSLLGGGQYFWAEAFHADSDKGKGLKVLADDCDIPTARSVAIGDNYNDLDMFAAAGFSVAMAGSPDDVKTRADMVTGPVAEGGAAEILEKIAAGDFPFTT
ncbi:MAG: HAD family phosphatase [Candidatus Krumholzibacteria bacterium]|nr:HAD family phosphatase [Candidatus Krumholzibacteria bacterium]